MTRQLTVTRKSSFYGAVTSHQIVIDGSPVSRLANGATVTLQIPTGSVVLEIVSKGYKPNRVVIPAGTGSVHADVAQKVGLSGHSFEISLSYPHGQYAPQGQRPPAPQPQESAIISCINCSAKMRVPRNRGRLEVTCPSCRRKFMYESGRKPAQQYSSGQQYDSNELRLFKRGGAQRMEMPDLSTCNDIFVVTRVLIASWIASYIVNIVLDRNSELWRKVFNGHGTTLDYVEVRLTRTGADFDIHIHHAPLDHFNYQYTYNEITESSGPVVTLGDWEIQAVLRMALSRVADLRPDSFVRGTRVSDHSI